MDPDLTTAPDFDAPSSRVVGVLAGAAAALATLAVMPLLLVLVAVVVPASVARGVADDARCWCYRRRERAWIRRTYEERVRAAEVVEARRAAEGRGGPFR